MSASVDSSMTYVPALAKRLVVSPGCGFSTNRSTRPSASVSTMPNCDGSSTGVSEIVAFAPLRRWNATKSATFRSVMTSPLATMNVPEIPAARAANPIAPAVSSGVDSTAYDIRTLPHMLFGNSAKNGSGLKPSANTTSVTPPSANRLTSLRIIGTCATGNNGFGMAYVNGRSRVPKPPTSTTACIAGELSLIVREGICDSRSRHFNSIWSECQHHRHLVINLDSTETGDRQL